MALILPPVLALVACAPLRGQRVQVSERVHRVELTVDFGSVTLLPAPAGTRVQIVRKARAFPETRGFHDKVVRGVLQVSARCGNAPGCRVDHELRVPPDVTVALQVGDGDVELDQISSDVQADVALGKVTGSGLRSADVDVRTEGGAIDLIFAAAPHRLVANAAAGDVSLRVPAGTYRCDLDTRAAGEIDVGCDDAAPHTIAASTGVGKLRLRATQR